MLEPFEVNDELELGDGVMTVLGVFEAQSRGVRTGLSGWGTFYANYAKKQSRNVC